MPEGLVEEQIAVVTKGEVPERAVEYARKKLGHLLALTGPPVLFARLRLLQHEDPAVERPAVVEASLDVNGRMVRAHRAARFFEEAVDLTEARLRDRLEHLAEQRRDRARRGVATGPGEWRHDSLPSVRPAWFPRPAEERELVRHKSLPVGEATLDEAVFDLELSDHDFHLFREIGASGDSLLVREGSGSYRLLRTGPVPEVEAPGGPDCRVDPAPVPELDFEEAVAFLEETGDRFVFYRDRRSGRGQVVYLRYDGHYGVVEPAA